MTHYNAKYIYMWDETVMNKVVICWRIANLYIGDFGVALFLIVSGAALMKTYEKGLSVKQFYIKRFWSIYPMFWIAYFAVFMYSFWVYKGIDQSVPKWSIILSVLGMDGYFNGLIPTYYKLGEWFLGFIIIFYLFFPILRLVINKYPLITAGVIGGIYLLVNCNYSLPMIKSIFLLTRLPEIAFGMYYVKYFKKNRWDLAVLGLLVIMINTIVAPAIDKDIQTTYVGIAAFIFLAYVADQLQDISLIVRGCGVLSKYSYAIFLTHHYIISNIVVKFDLYKITVLESYLLFALCCIVIAFWTKVLYEVNSYIVNRIKRLSF